MPAKSKRKQQLEGGREAKNLKRDGFSEDAFIYCELSTSVLLDDSGAYISDDDVMHDPDVDYKSDMEAKINQFAKEWVKSLNRDDTMALTMFLYSFLVFRFQFTLCNSAKLISELLGYSDRPIRQWRSILSVMKAHFLIQSKENTNKLVFCGKMKTLINK